MATSQFTIYSSADYGAPVLNGATGSLVNVLNKILVTGYGTKTSAGWSADFTSSNGSGSTYRPPSGSRCYLSVNDMVPDGYNQAARLIGFTTATEFDSGSGQFPRTNFYTTYQFDHLYCRKSPNLPNMSPSTWICFADAYTCYFRVQSGDSQGGLYNGGFVFGDYYSFSLPENFSSNCILQGSSYAKTGNQLSNEYSLCMEEYVESAYFQRIYTPGYSPGPVSPPWLYRNVNAAFMSSSYYANSNLISLNQCPNPVDNSIWVYPITICQVQRTELNSFFNSKTIGKMRGEYFVCAPPGTFSTGQIITGNSGNYAGKQLFMINGERGTMGIEISPTVETN